MSLTTDKVFYNALRSNPELMQAVGGRIYNTTIPVPDEELLNEPLPYVIITYDGMTNEGYTKDNNYEGCTDRVQISIEVAAENREQLGQLIKQIRQIIIDYFEDDLDHAWDDYHLVPNNYVLSASAIGYDSMKPCYYQTLQYQCDTNP